MKHPHHYKLENCITGSNHKRLQHIPDEYERITENSSLRKIKKRLRSIIGPVAEMISEDIIVEWSVGKIKGSSQFPDVVNILISEIIYEEFRKKKGH